MNDTTQQAEITTEWRQYQSGIDYNNRIGHYDTVNKNERFYAGDQWAGVVANGLPTPVFNIFKRITNYFVAAILSQNFSMQFVPESVGDEAQTADEEEIKQAAELISAYSETLKEKRKMNKKLRRWLKDAALTGDAAAYNWWNTDIDYGQAAKGDIDIQAVKSVNVFFGDPNEPDPQCQPYIIISFRSLISKLQDEARSNKVADNLINLITADDDTFYQSGDRSRIELDKKDSTVGKTIALLKLWKKDGKVFAKKITKYTTIREEWDTQLSCYPVAWMNWDERDNSYHGQAMGTGLTPNQIFINKMFAMAMMSQMHTAFPKAIYNSDLITAWNNQIGAAVGIKGTNGPLSNYAMYLNPGNMSEQVFRLIDLAIQYTKDMLGASDAAMGDVKPQNTSAIIAVQQAAAIPLETIKQNLYQFIEDIGYIWLEFMANHYGTRKIDVEILGKREIREFDFAKLKTMKLRIKVEVGPSSYWSEITAMQTLDHLLEKDKITFMQYLDRVPSGMIPQKQELINEHKAQDQKQQFIYEQMARFLEGMPPQVQQSIKGLQPQQQEQVLMDIMMMPPDQQQAKIKEIMAGQTGGPVVAQPGPQPGAQPGAQPPAAGGGVVQ